MNRDICVVITARASYSRIRSALKAIDNHNDLNLHLVVAGSALLHDYGNMVDHIREDGFEIAEKVYMILEGENLTSMAKSTGLGLMELSTALDNLNPDAVVTVADRHETIATAISASYMNIPVAHVQGGEITGSIDEKVRHAVTKLSNLHFVSHEKAKERVIRMGENPETVFVTGCPSIDLADRALEHPELTFDPYKKYGGVGSTPELDDGYLVVMQHPVTTEYEQSHQNASETLEAVKNLDTAILWFWPNVDAGSDGTSEAIRTYREKHDLAHFHFFKNMYPEDFLKLLINSQGIVGNSSVGIRECSYMGVPAVNIGTRQQGRDRGKNVVDVAYDREEIASAIKEHQLSSRTVERDRLYGNGDAGEIIANLLAEQPLQVRKKLSFS